jgi:hypothetical protein
MCIRLRWGSTALLHKLLHDLLPVLKMLSAIQFVWTNMAARLIDRNITRDGLFAELNRLP